MEFFTIKVPKDNEYTYEQTLAVLTSICHPTSHKWNWKTFRIIPKKIISLNIVSVNQNIYFVIGCDENESQHIKNQLLAQYPNADIKSIGALENLIKVDYQTANIAEIKLAKNELIPIHTIDKSGEIDNLTGVLSTIARSKDEKEFYIIQIVISGARAHWQSQALARINKINSATTITQGMRNEITQLQEKIKFNAFNTNIRLITSSKENTLGVFNAFAGFANPSGNRFTIKYPNLLNRSSLSKAVAEHKASGNRILLNLLELSTIWHLPNSNVKIPNIVWGKHLYLDPPENLPVSSETMTEEEKQNLTFIGKTTYKNKERIFGIKADDRLRHTYLVGKTGTGKSWFLVNMAIEDIRKGNGVAVLDPHGDAIETILNFIPKNRINDVCYFNPADSEYSYPLNILEVENETQKDLMVSGIIGIFYKLYAHSWGPRLEHILRNILFTLADYKDSTLLDIIKILHDKKFRHKVLNNITDPTLIDFWEKEFEGMSESFANEAISPILNKVGQFVTSPLVRRIIQHPKSKVKIDEIMNSKKIFLCDLSQGKIGEDNATLLGSMIITKIQIAAMNRSFIPEVERIPFYMYVDEFQNFATQSFTKILSEARKYKLGLTLANQYITQIDEDVMNAILGNVGTLACFSVGAKDSEILFKEFGSTITPEDLSTLEKYQMIIRLMIDKVTTQPFTYQSLPLPKNQSGHKDKIIEQSRKKYGVRVQ